MALFALFLLVPWLNLSAATFTVSNVNDSGAGSLRQAILNANGTFGADRIEFNISGAGPYSIRLLSQLPVITDPVTIDATTQPGFGGQPIVELTGSIAGPNVSGILITAGNSTVKGLVLNRFLNGNGIELHSPNNVVQGNYIGTDVTGRNAAGNTWAAILVYNSASNTIGGTVASARNIISANGQSGIQILQSGAIGNVVQGNYIGFFHET